MRKNISSKTTLMGQVATSFEVSDHRVISGSAAVPAVPAVAAQGTEGQPGYVPAVAAVPEVPAVAGTVDSQVAFYDTNGKQLLADRARLNPSQFAGWDNAGPDDDAYFFACHCANLSVTPL